MYALCKHGPNCCRHSRGTCGFAHSLDDVSLPGHSLSFASRWVDESHVSRGRPAPDLFVGQRYTFNQQSRILSYVARCDPPYPTWVNLYLWLLRHPRYTPDHRRDLGWYSLADDLRALLRDAFFNDVESLLVWKAPWVYCTDMLGEDFLQRMKYRLANAVPYWRVVATRAFTEADAYRDTTSMHWGRYSKKYLNVTQGEQFVLLAESVEPFSGWAWVAEYPYVKEYGWVPRNCLQCINEYVFLEGAILAEVCAQPYESDSVLLSNERCPHDLGCVCPDGTDLKQYPNLAVCISDGSADEKCGIAAASICIFPSDSSEWEDPAAAIKMYARGSATAELVGMAFSLNTLLQNPAKFETAVVYTDNATCVSYIGDSTRIGSEPVSDDGWKLYLLIVCVRKQVLHLENLGKRILVKWLPRKYNVADKIATACMRNERDMGWPLSTCIPRVDAVPGLLECIRQVSENSEKVANGVRISRSVHDIGETTAQHMYVRTSVMDAGSIQDEFL